MVIVRILGGLGNQILAFSFAYSVSKICSENICLDVSDYYKGYIWQYALDYLRIPDYVKIKIFTKEEKSGILNSCDLIIEESQNIRKREDLKSLISYKHLDKNIYINGYGNIEVCTKDELYDLQNIFSIKENKSYMGNLYKQINNEISVSVHIRSGDFITDDNEYYMAAIQYVKELFPDAVFYFFSVETSIDSIKDLFGSDNKYHYIRFSGNYQETIDELSCITACKIHIISTDSSFSQFSAWHDNKKNKIIILSHKTKYDFFKINEGNPVILDNDMIEELSKKYKSFYNSHKFLYDNQSVMKQIDKLEKSIFTDIEESRKIISYLYSHAELYDADIWMELLIKMGKIYYNENKFIAAEQIFEKCIMYKKINSQVINLLLKCYKKQIPYINKVNLINYIQKYYNTSKYHFIILSDINLYGSYNNLMVSLGIWLRMIGHKVTLINPPKKLLLKTIDGNTDDAVKYMKENKSNLPGAFYLDLAVYPSVVNNKGNTCYSALINSLPGEKVILNKFGRLFKEDTNVENSLVIHSDFGINRKEDKENIFFAAEHSDFIMTINKDFYNEIYQPKLIPLENKNTESMQSGYYELLYSYPYYNTPLLYEIIDKIHGLINI